MTQTTAAGARTGKKKIVTQPRDQSTGQFGFEGNWGRKCVCGHELGFHSAEAPHDCMNIDRYNIGINDEWVDQSITNTPCDCMKFRPSRKRAALAKTGSA